MTFCRVALCNVMECVCWLRHVVRMRPLDVTAPPHRLSGPGSVQPAVQAARAAAASASAFCGGSTP